MTPAGRRPGPAVAGLVVCAAWFSGVACATGATEGGGGVKRGAPSGGDGVGRPAPELVVERMNGKSLALSSMRGKVVLLDVWASWCPPCVQELPMLDAIARRLRGRGVEVLAVSVDQKRANVVKFLERQPHWTLTVAHDPRQEIADTLQPDKMPTSYAIDRNGVIRYINSGFEPADAAVIERRLAELAGPAGQAGQTGDSDRDRDGDGDGDRDRGAAGAADADHGKPRRSRN